MDTANFTHAVTVAGLQKTISKYLATEESHRELIRSFSFLGSSDPDKVMLAAFGMCGLRAVPLAPGEIAAHRPPEMSRRVYREKARLAKKLAAQSFRLVHSKGAAR